MPIVISLSGRSNSGKTTLLEKLIGELKRRGHKVAAVKHSFHDIDLDQPGKDSWRLARAGSDAVLVSSPNKLYLSRKLNAEAPFEELLALLADEYDVVLMEGFKGASIGKIEVHRKELGGLVCPRGETIAVVTDEPLDVDVPQFTADQIELLADFVESQPELPPIVPASMADGR